MIESAATPACPGALDQPWHGLGPAGRADDHPLARLEDSGLFPRDRLQGIAEIILVIQRHPGHCRDLGGNRIGRIQPSAEADFQDRHLHGSAGKHAQAQQGHLLEECERAHCDAVELLGRPKNGRTRCRLSVDGEALGELREMRRCEETGSLASSAGDGLDERRGRALAVGPGDMHPDRGHILGVPQLAESLFHALEPEHDAGSPSVEEPLQELAVNVRHVKEF